MNLESPFTILLLGIVVKISISASVKILPLLLRIPFFLMKGVFPSTIMYSGNGFSFKIHSCIAFMEAFNMLIESISSGSRWVTANDIACCSMSGFSSSLVFSESCLLSFNISLAKSTGSITAAAVTGPARHPRPASSVPDSKFFVKKKGLNMCVF